MWKQINDFPSYQISDTGEIKSLERTITNSLGQTYVLKARILKPRTSGKGYIKVTLRKDNKSFEKYIHILVAEHYIDNPENLPVVNHKDGNKQNCSVDNLEWITYSGNNQHAYDNNLKSRGEGFYNAKLTEKDVAEIKKLGKYTTYQNIADKYGVTKATIRDILVNRTWKNVN